MREWLTPVPFVQALAVSITGLTHWRMCRLKVSKNGFAGQALGESCALLLLRGKIGRCEAPPGAIADAVNALMDALHFPAAATVNSQVTAPPSSLSATIYPLLC